MTHSADASAARRRTVAIAALLVTVAVLIGFSLLIGSNAIGWDQVLRALRHPSQDTDSIVWGSRVPRTVLAVVIGACLGLAGTIMQGQTRNPLADPGLFGVSAGASLAVVIASQGFAVTSSGQLIWYAMAGAMVASVVVFAIALAGSSTASPVPLALAGAAVSALAGAAISYLITTDQSSLNAYRVWVIGSLSGHSLAALGQLWPYVAVGLLLALLNARGLNALSLGTEVATGLGERILQVRLVGLGAITLLTAAAVAIAGPIGFIGLTAPHVARRMVGVSHGWLLPAAALSGAAVLLATDTVARVLGGMNEIPVGAVLATVGGIAFIAIVRRSRMVAL